MRVGDCRWGPEHAKQIYLGRQVTTQAVLATVSGLTGPPLCSLLSSLSSLPSPQQSRLSLGKGHFKVRITKQSQPTNEETSFS